MSSNYIHFMNKTALMGISAVILLILIGVGALYINQSRTTVTPTPTVGQTALPTTVPAAGISEEGTVKDFTIEASGFKFEPATMRVNQGDTVRVTYKNTQGIHDFVLDEFNVATNQIADGEEEIIEFIADKTGTFEYYCSVGNHRAMGMKGTLVVQ
jgi:nitrosocyanin